MRETMRETMRATSPVRTFVVIVGGLLLTAAAASAQDAPRSSPGDTVEAHSYFYNPPWHQAVVVSVGKGCSAPALYRVHFIGPDAGDHGDPCVGADGIRRAERPSLGGGTTAGDARPNDRPTPPLPRAGAYRLGDRVDVFAADNRDKAARGTIVAAAGGRYRVRYDGCGADKDAVVGPDELHPAATISADAPGIRFLVGAWKMFTPSYPNTVVRGNTVYREYGMGASAPPLRIGADGTYTWYDEYDKPPVRGRWTPDAKIEGARYWTAFTDGVVIRDAQGGLWKVYRRTIAGDREDRVTAQTMCSGLTLDGTRIR